MADVVMTDRPTLVTTCSNLPDDYSLFGENNDSLVYSVHVLPVQSSAESTTRDRQWEVRVVEQTATEASSTRGVIHGDWAFSALQSALHACSTTFSSPLPNLHLKQSLLESATPCTDDAKAEDLQKYLSELVAHPEARLHPAFLEFIKTDDATEEASRSNTTFHKPLIVRAKSQSLSEKSTDAKTPGTPGTPGKPSPVKCTKVKLSWVDEEGEHECELPVLSPSFAMGNRVIDVRTLGARTGFFTHDPGFTSTSSCLSAITFIDGEKGELLHRGYPIADLARACSFPEVAYLLIEGELPSATQLSAFTSELKRHTMVHERLISFFQGFSSDAHPMAVMVGVVGALSSFYPDSQDIHEPEQRRLSAVRLIAKMPTIAAICHKHAIGEPVVYPQHDLPFAANFLRMMFATPCEPYHVNPIHARALETIFILHADHEQNASTSTVRIASSSQANPFACIAAGIASLWGPAHGGANEAVLRMLDEIGTPDRIPLFLAKAKDKADPFRLMGFGHRVYKNFDPRAKLMRGICAEVLATIQHRTVQLELAQQLEAAALADEYFVKRKLYPNVDFYSGIVLSAIGIPREMFTVIFAVARCAGWLAQWNESFADTQQRISRPRQLYVGAPRREFVAQSDR